MRAEHFALAVPIALVATALAIQAHPPFNPFDATVFAPIERFGPLIELEPVAAGLVAPNKGVVAPGERPRLYVVDQPGVIWALELDTGVLTPFLDVGPAGLNLLIPLGFLGPNTFDERGLLGLAFHPDYQRNGRFYTYTSEPSFGPPTFKSTLPAGTPADHQNVVSEWRAVAPGNPSLGVQSGRRVLARIDWPQFNHNGGDLAFGPDGLLYISTGEGGNADDQGVGHGPIGNAQDLSVPLGKILRIDVNGANSSNGQYGIPESNPFVSAGGGAVTEIFAFGFRNPFRMSFDTQTGELLVGDVGQNDIEEVDRVVRGGNYGWRIKEGTLFFNPNGDADGFATPEPPGPVPPRLIDPIAQYDTHHEGHSVIGGFVYRGNLLPRLRGRYVFGDFSVLFKFPSGPHDYGRLFHLRRGSQRGVLSEISEFHIARGNAVSLAVLGFGQDAEGEIYIMGNVSGVPFGTGGVVMRLAPHEHAGDDHDGRDQEADD
jgi:glucose/arabinose dehydrogenase